MGDWPVRTIAECASHEPYSTQIGPFGKALMAEQYVERGVPVLRGVNVNQGRFHDDDFVFIDSQTAEKLAKFESFPGDVLLVHKGTIGQIGLMPEKRKHSRYIMGNSMMRVRCDRSKLLPEYLYYWLSSPFGLHYLTSRLSQVGVPQIQTPLTSLRQAAFPVPPTSEQKAIVEVLGSLDDKIELNRRMNETLEAIARAIFKSWFVDFDPVHAKSQGRQPFGMNADTAAHFPNSFERSSPDETPSGWRIGKMSELASLTRDSLAPEHFANELFNHYSIPAFDEGRWPKPENGRDIKSNKFTVPVNAVLLSKLNPRIPRVWLTLPSNERRSIASTEFLVAISRPPCSREYLYCLFGSHSFAEVFENLVTGTSGSHQRVRPEFLLNMDVLIPSPESIDAFTHAAKALLERVAKNIEESQSLASIRDLLLPKLISGEIRIKDAEQLIGEKV